MTDVCNNNSRKKKKKPRKENSFEVNKITSSLFIIVPVSVRDLRKYQAQIQTDVAYSIHVWDKKGAEQKRAEKLSLTA